MRALYHRDQEGSMRLARIVFAAVLAFTFIWAQAADFQGLGFIGSGNVFYQAEGIFADGKVIVGSSTLRDGTGNFTLGTDDFRLTPAAGLVRPGSSTSGV